MPVDPEKLLAFDIPEVSHYVTPRDAAFYALSVGLGSDPCDLDQLPFVDPLAGPPILPSMVMVLAHPGFWLGDPRSGVDPAAVLHAAQRYQIMAPLRAGMTVSSKTRVTGLTDKGAGKPALIDAETALTDDNGTLVARLNRTTFVRNGGGFGGDVPPRAAAAPVPTMPADETVDLSTAVTQALFYRLNGDLNPLHSDPAVAARAGFDRPILHGLCTMGVVTHALIRARTHYAAHRLSSMAMRFCSPVYPGETIRTEIWHNGTFQVRAVERDVVVADQGAFSLTVTSKQNTMEATS